MQLHNPQGSRTALSRRAQLGRVRNLSSQVVASGAVCELAEAPPLSRAVADADALRVGPEGFEPEGDGGYGCPGTGTRGAAVGPPFSEPMGVGGGRLCPYGWGGNRGGACAHAAFAFRCAFEHTVRKGPLEARPLRGPGRCRTVVRSMMAGSGCPACL